MAPSGSPASGEASVVDLRALPGEGGVVWSVSPEGFHTNLVVLGAGGSIAEHTNDELDVLIVVIDGSATVTIDGTTRWLGEEHAVLVPRGAARASTAGPRGARYLTIHGPRAPLGPRPRRSTPPPTPAHKEPPR